VENNSLISYLAGYFDGEGSISMTNDLRAPQLHIQVGSADEDVIDLFCSTFGGRKSITKPQSMTKRQQYKWALVGSKAQNVLWKLYPYLRAKVYPASFALIPNYSRTQSRKKYWNDKTEFNIRQEMKKEITEFNNRVTI